MSNPDAIPAGNGETKIPAAFEHPVITMPGVSDEHNLQYLRQAALDEAFSWVERNRPEAIH